LGYLPPPPKNWKNFTHGSVLPLEYRVLTYIRGSTGGGGAREFTGGVGFNNLLYLLKDLQAILVKYQRESY